MQPVTTDPPHIPLGAAGWPTRRSPRWAIAAGAAMLLIAVAVGLSHRPSTAQRATDLRGFLQSLNSDVESCSGGVRDSLYALRAIDSWASYDVKTAINIASIAAANCSPANNELLDNLFGEQVPESLSSYHLKASVTALIDWAAPDAQRAAGDIVTVLTGRGRPAEAAARAALRLALRKLDAQRSVVYAALEPAIRALSPQSSPPKLYG